MKRSIYTFNMRMTEDDKEAMADLREADPGSPDSLIIRRLIHRERNRVREEAMEVAAAVARSERAIARAERARIAAIPQIQYCARCWHGPRAADGMRVRVPTNYGDTCTACGGKEVLYGRIHA